MFENVIEILYRQGGDVNANLKPYNSFHTIVLPYIE
jgi:hypothetical protein